MPIEIDDSGTGDVIGPAFIGLRRVENNKIIIKKISKKEFGLNHMIRKQVCALEIVKQGLIELNFEATEKIQLCRGDTFHRVRQYFDKNSYDHEPAEIDGVLQDILEESYEKWLKEKGIDISRLPHGKDKKMYYKTRIKTEKNWVAKDFENRQKYIKIGYGNAHKSILHKAREHKSEEDIKKHMDLKAWDSALKLIEKLIREYPSNINAYFYKAIILNKKGLFKDALDILDNELYKYRDEASIQKFRETILEAIKNA